MTRPNQFCPKCGEAMSVGFIADWSEGDVRISRWLEGEPVSGWVREVNPDKNDQWKVVTYRCNGCGFLESYAKRPSP